MFFLASRIRSRKKTHSGPQQKIIPDPQHWPDLRLLAGGRLGAAGSLVGPLGRLLAALAGAAVVLAALLALLAGL